MPKNRTPNQPTPPRRLREKLPQAYDLLEHGHPAEALPILLKLDKAYPNTSEVIGCLANAYHALGDNQSYEHSVRRMFRLEPHDPDIHLGLAGAYMANLRPALALQTFQGYLRRWPEHSEVSKVHKTLPVIEQAIQEQATLLGLSYEQGFDLALQHDELRYCLSHGEYSRARLVADKLLNRFPNFVPALNNLGQIYAVEGDLEKAIQIAHRVLDIEPENVHALSNLARLHFLRGRPVEARQYADLLKRSPADATDRWTKIAEALTMIGDDEGVLSLYPRARAVGELEPPNTDEIFFHLLAVAACRLGKRAEAGRFWKKALKINPVFDWARDNLADFELPVSQRRGCWAYPLESWLLASIVRETSGYMGKLKHAASKADVQAQLTHFFTEKHPEVIFLAPYLIERGDAKACEFVVRMAAISAHPALVETARAFVFGQRGTLEERFNASKILSEAELLSSGKARMWSEGKWSEVLLLSAEISPEPVKTNRPKQVEKLFLQAWQATQEQDGARAQELLEKAVALFPDDPGLLNNLAMAYQMQGHTDRAQPLLVEINTRFPDYFFGVIGMANLAIIDGNLKKAHGLLDGLMQRKKMHTSECNALCASQIRLSLAEGNREAARSWLGLWEEIDPDNPDLPDFRLRVASPVDFLSAILKRK